MTNDTQNLKEMGASSLNQAERIELPERIGQAINSQKLKIDDPSVFAFCEFESIFLGENRGDIDIVHERYNADGTLAILSYSSLLGRMKP